MVTTAEHSHSVLMLRKATAGDKVFHCGLITIKCFQVDYFLTALRLDRDQKGLRENYRCFCSNAAGTGRLSPQQRLGPRTFLEGDENKCYSEGRSQLRVESITWEGVVPFVMSQM